jgi:capsular polysaccharide transport system permease protein
VSDALTIQLNVLWALVLREMKTRFGRRRLGYLWALVGPFAMIAVLMALFSFIGRLAPAGMDFPVFLITGIVPWFLFNTTTQQAMNAIDGNRRLLVHARVKPLDLIVARGLLETATYLVVFVLLLALAGALGYQFLPDRLLPVLATLLGVALLGTGLGAAVAPLQLVFPGISNLMPATKRPLYFISGVFFSVEVVPEPWRGWLLINPLLHANEIMRAGFFASYDGRHADPAYLLAWIAGLVFAGLLVQRAARQWILVTA